MKKNPIAYLDSESISENLDKEGYALLPKLLDSAQAGALAALALAPGGETQQHSLDDLGLGQGTLWHLTQALPDSLPIWHKALYELLAPIANRWSQAMGATPADQKNPARYLQEEREPSHFFSQASINRLRQDDYQVLHQSLNGEKIFPLQLIILLSAPGTDFSGGEFVMTEQRPHMQSRPIVLPLRLGDAALITVARRPVKGSKGYYRVNMKHAIGRVRHGERFGLELLFRGLPTNPYL